jgi:DNA-binding MarR family transcriptional regulator
MRALWEVEHALFSASKRMKARLGVTGPERLVIRIVGELPDISPGELAEIMHLDPSTLTGVLQRLVRRRLLVRGLDSRDARRSRLRLTREGQAIDRIRSGTVEAGVRAALEAIAPRDVASTVRVLGALSRVLNGLSFEGVRAPLTRQPAPRSPRRERAPALGRSSLARRPRRTIR